MNTLKGGRKGSGAPLPVPLATIPIVKSVTEKDRRKAR